MYDLMSLLRHSTPASKQEEVMVGYYKNAPKEDEVLLKEIAKISCERSGGQWGDPNNFSRVYYMVTAGRILTKAREAVEGAGLTDDDIQYAAGLYSWVPPAYRKVAKAQLQAILKALGGE